METGLDSVIEEATELLPQRGGLDTRPLYNLVEDGKEESVSDQNTHNYISDYSKTTMDYNIICTYIYMDVFTLSTIRTHIKVLIYCMVISYWSGSIRRERVARTALIAQCIYGAYMLIYVSQWNST